MVFIVFTARRGGKTGWEEGARGAGGEKGGGAEEGGREGPGKVREAVLLKLSWKALL